MVQTVFNRVEKKYLMPADLYHQLRQGLAAYMEEDQYGLHTICNLYYDTPQYDLIRRSIDKPVYKEKLRLRSYGVPTLDSTVFLEIKKKYQKTVNKRRVQLTLREAYDYLEGGGHPSFENQILNEIDFCLQRYCPKPGMYLAYDRIALFARDDPDFRVTFDQNIRSRQTDMRLEMGDEGQRLLPEGWYLMESKVLGSAPLWFAQLLAGLKIYPVSFSKYGNAYKKLFDAFHPESMMVHSLENWNVVRRREHC